MDLTLITQEKINGVYNSYSYIIGLNDDLKSYHVTKKNYSNGFDKKQINININNYVDLFNYLKENNKNILSIKLLDEEECEYILSYEKAM